MARSAAAPGRENRAGMGAANQNQTSGIPDLALFGILRESSIDWVLDNAMPETHIANTNVINEGETPQALYIVAHGLYGASVSQGNGSRQELGRLAAGAVFGEMAWLGRSVASATVAAVETSEAWVLSLDVLEAKLAADTPFAADFMGALARLLTARQHNTNATLLRHVDAAAIFATATGSATELQVSFSWFKEIAAQCDKEGLTPKGLSTEARDAFFAAFNQLNANFEKDIRELEVANPAAAEAFGSRVQSEFMPFLCRTQTALRFYSKPRGYAGDFMTIEHIYDEKVGGTGTVGILLDQVLMYRPPPQAVRNRRGILKQRIIDAMIRAPSPGYVLSLACGPAREISDTFAALPLDHRPRVTLLDIDTEALTLVGARLAKEGLAEHCTLVQANLIRLALGREMLDVPPQDLIYSIGLIDYFNDEFIVHLLQWIHDRLAPGGEVILGNFHPANSGKAFMDYVLEWKLIHRSEEDMKRLFAASPFGGCTEILFEDAGINLFAVGRKS